MNRERLEKLRAIMEQGSEENMSALEQRQARRMIRNAKELERHVFELVDSLQKGLRAKKYDWADALRSVLSIKEFAAIVHDVAFTCLDEMPPAGSEEGDV